MCYFKIFDVNSPKDTIGRGSQERRGSCAYVSGRANKGMGWSGGSMRRSILQQLGLFLIQIFLRIVILYVRNYFQKTLFCKGRTWLWFSPRNNEGFKTLSQTWIQFILTLQSIFPSVFMGNFYQQAKVLGNLFLFPVHPKLLSTPPRVQSNTCTMYILLYTIFQHDWHCPKVKCSVQKPQTSAFWVNDQCLNILFSGSSNKLLIVGRLQNAVIHTRSLLLRRCTSIAFLTRILLQILQPLWFRFWSNFPH